MWDEPYKINLYLVSNRVIVGISEGKLNRITNRKL